LPPFYDAVARDDYGRCDKQRCHQDDVNRASGMVL